MTIVDKARFISEQTRLLPVPYAPEIKIHVADEATELWQKTEDELGQIGLPPPFWAFAWAGGQALARYILDHPEHVRGKRVLDFASGSGLVAIAAAMAGASAVKATDIDAFAVEAIRINARANAISHLIHISDDDIIEQDDGWDCVLAGDICYQKDIAERVIAWLQQLSQRGAVVFIGDPGRSYLPKEVLIAVAHYEVPTTRSLEDAEIKKSAVWQFRTRESL